MLEPTPSPSSPSRDWRAEWSLDRRVTFLNHGSFGACPHRVLQRQMQLRTELESQPLRFLWRRYEERLDAARTELAAFLGADRRQLVFVPNATTGINSVLRSLSFEPGDELVVTNHEYNATRNVLNFVAERAGATVVEADVPFPIASEDSIVEAVMKKVSARTRLVLADHVTSLTGLIFPIAELAARLEAGGVDLLVDGAHAPGMIDLNLDLLGVPFYAGNCHKWLCAPKGAGFLYVRGDRQPQIRPTTISHGANAVRPDRPRFWLEFDWTGTDDPTAYLSVPAAIRFLESLLPGGWPELSERNRALARKARRRLCEALDIQPPCPESLIGAMATLPLPDRVSSSPPPSPEHDDLEDVLEERFGIVVPVRFWPTHPHRVLRISAHAYNNLREYEMLADALTELLRP